MEEGFTIMQADGKLLSTTFAVDESGAIGKFCHPMDWDRWQRNGWSVERVALVSVNKLKSKKFLEVLENWFKAK